MPLGSFTLEPGQDHRIELRNVGTEGRMNADAVRLVYEGESLMVAADAVRFVPNAISGAAYVHGDHLGTPAKMTGDAGTVIRDAAYKPFGGEASVVGSENLDLRFPGQIQDLESGRGLASLVVPLHYNYFRDYDPASGRYLQVDPIGLAGGLNPYGYANQNPGIYIDPNGLLFQQMAAGCIAGPLGCLATGVATAALIYYLYQNPPIIPGMCPTNIPAPFPNLSFSKSPGGGSPPPGRGRPKTDPQKGNPSPPADPDASDPNASPGRQGAGNPVPAPNEIEGIPGLSPSDPKTPVQGGGKLRKRWKDKNGNIYEWDYQHGTVEKYNKRGKWQGEFDPATGNKIDSKAKSKKGKRRKVEP